VVTVYLPVKLENRVLPINVVTSVQNGEGYIYVLKDEKPIKYDVELGQTRGDKIEIISKLPVGMEVILSDVGNFDEEGFVIVVGDE